MEKCLLSIDWDYFIYPQNQWGSYLENTKSLIDLWYKRYIQKKALGEDIQKVYCVSSELDAFWDKIKARFPLSENIHVYVSDSHALSYEIAIRHDCKVVCLFDAHADLGYGGLSSLNFETNCSNWLGKLLKDKHIREAHIFYSPYTTEKMKYFDPMNNIYNIHYYYDFDDFNPCAVVSAIHLCRSGAWTPPWLDEKFNQFVNRLGTPYQIVNCPERSWDPNHISLSDQINYLMA